PVIDAAVPAGRDAVLELQLEVFWPPSAPDDEGVALENRFGRDLADEGPLLDSPVFRVPFPAVQGFPVEDRREAGLIPLDRAGPIRLLRDERRLPRLRVARAVPEICRCETHSKYDSKLENSHSASASPGKSGAGRLHNWSAIPH